MDPVTFMNAGVVVQPWIEYVSFWKMFKGHSEVFYRMEVAPERDFECH